MSTKTQQMTPAQLAAYWKTFSRSCDAQGLRDHVVRETYRKNVMKEECGIASVKEMNRTSDFDRVMGRFLADAGEWELAVKYTGGDEERIAYNIRACTVQIMQLQMLQPHDVGSYILGCLKQACLVPRERDSYVWLDIPRGSLVKVFQMLDTRRRALLKKRLEERRASVAIGTKVSLSFSPQIRYRVGLEFVGIFNSDTTTDDPSIRVKVTP